MNDTYDFLSRLTRFSDPDSEFGFVYDSGGRNTYISPDTTITKTVFDWKDNPTQTWIGTSPANMVLVSETVYSGETGCPTCTGTTAQPRLSIQYADAETMRITEFGYDWRGRRIHTHYEEDAQGNSTFDLTTYDNLDRAVKSEKYLADDFDGRLLARSEQFYDERGQVWKTDQSIVDPETGAVQGLLLALNWYDAAGRTVKSQPAGETKQNRTTYDSLGRVIRTDVALPDGTVYQQSEYVYDATGHAIQTASADRLVNQSGAGPLLIDAAPQGRFQFAASWYDGAGREIASADLGAQASRLQKEAVETSALPVPARSDTVLITETFYDPATGRTYKTVDPAGNVTEIVYSTLGDVVKRILPKPNASSPAPEYVTEYDNIGRVVAQIDPMGNRTQTIYGDFSRIAATIDPMNNRTEYTYNRIGEVVSQTDPQGNVTRFVYDNLGRRVQIIQPKPNAEAANPVIETQYTPLGQVERIIDALGNVTSMEYDGLGRLIAKVDALSGRTSYTYDGAGRMLSLTDPAGNMTTYVYDVIGRVVSETNALNKTRTIEYFAGSLVGKKIDRMGRYITFEYDRFDNKTAERWYSASDVLERTMTYTYENLSRLTCFSDSDSEFGFLYDNSGRNTHISASFTGLTPTVVQTQAFNLNNRRTAAELKVGIVNDSQTRYGYNANNQTTSIAFSGYGILEKRVEYSYNSVNNVVTKSAYSVDNHVYSAQYSYDGMNRQTGIVNTHGETTLANYGLTWDAKRITGFSSTIEEQSPESAAYSYDDTDQLLGAQASRLQKDADGTSALPETYTYDANGNRTMPGYTTGTNNQLVNDGSFRYEYDDEGNCLAKIPNSGTGITIYSWDHRNRLIQAVTPTETVSYAYDYLNRLIRRNDEYFVHDDYQITAILNADGAIKRRFFWGAKIDELLGEFPESDVSLWPLTDHLGTIRDVASDSGALINHLDYSAFGQLTSQTDSDYQPYFLYTGKWTDPATNLQYNINRWYNAATGRWMSTDPIGFEAGDPNLYRYVGNRTMYFVDFRGYTLCSCESLLEKFINSKKYQFDLYLAGNGSSFYVVGGSKRFFLRNEDLPVFLRDDKLRPRYKELFSRPRFQLKIFCGDCSSFYGTIANVKCAEHGAREICLSKDRIKNANSVDEKTFNLILLHEIAHLITAPLYVCDKRQNKSKCLEAESKAHAYAYDEILFYNADLINEAQDISIIFSMRTIFINYASYLSCRHLGATDNPCSNREKLSSYEVKICEYLDSLAPQINK